MKNQTRENCRMGTIFSRRAKGGVLVKQDNNIDFESQEIQRSKEEVRRNKRWLFQDLVTS